MQSKHSPEMHPNEMTIWVTVALTNTVVLISALVNHVPAACYLGFAASVIGGRVMTSTPCRGSSRED